MVDIFLIWTQQKDVYRIPNFKKLTDRYEQTLPFIEILSQTINSMCIREIAWSLNMTK